MTKQKKQSRNKLVENYQISPWSRAVPSKFQMLDKTIQDFGVQVEMILELGGNKLKNK